MPSIIRIGDLTLDIGRQRLMRDAQPVHLGPLTWKLLLALVEAAPNVATLENLAVDVWGGRRVSPETISQRVKLLRDAIGDRANSPRYVELVRGRGYRLLLPAVEVDTTVPSIGHRRRTLIAAALVLIFAAVILARTFLTPGIPSATASSLAVLPFVDMSPEQNQDYLAAGIAEEILNLLASTTSMPVIARTSSFSFKDRNVDIPTIAETLNVTHVLEGSIRKSADRVRITVQLVDASEGSHVWSDTYDRQIGDILVLQSEIAASVAAALNVNWPAAGRPAPTAARQVDPDALESYLRGLKDFRNYSTGYEEARQYFERAIRIDPGFVPAYNQLGLVYVLEVVAVLAPLPQNRERLRDVVRRGLAIAPDNAGLIGLSGQVARYDGNIELAERRFRRALEMDSSSIPVRQVYGMMKLDQGRPREALEIGDRVLETDPLNPYIYLHRWACHLDLGNLEEAIAAAARYQDVAHPSDITGLTLSGGARMLLAGDFVGLIREYKKASAVLFQDSEPAYAHPLFYYYLDDLETGDAAMESARQRWGYGKGPIPDNPYELMTLAYRDILVGGTSDARKLAVRSLLERKPFTGMEPDVILARLAVDELIAAGDAGRVVEKIETMAPVYKDYRSRPHVPAKDFFPAPMLVKSAYSSFPASYFPDYVRALRAVGDRSGAENMLNHLEAILQLRRDRELFIEERYTAEAFALRGDTEAALAALEQAERDRTLHQAWRLFVLHNEIFAGIRDHPRFEALVERIRTDMARQREELLQ